MLGSALLGATSGGAMVFFGPDGERTIPELDTVV